MFRREPGESVSMATVHYSDGRSVASIIQVWEDLHTERAGYFRAFWSASPDATTGSPIIGYCSAGGSHRTIGAVVAEVRRLGHRDAIDRNGRLISAQRDGGAG